MHSQLMKRKWQKAIFKFSSCQRLWCFVSQFKRRWPRCNYLNFRQFIDKQFQCESDIRNSLRFIQNKNFFLAENQLPTSDGYSFKFITSIRAVSIQPEDITWPFFGDVPQHGCFSTLPRTVHDYRLAGKKTCFDVRLQMASNISHVLTTPF